MKLLALAIPLLVAATAHAQAPGEMAPMESAPGAGPSTVDPCGCTAAEVIPVMANRWAVGLGVGSLTISPQNQPDNKTQFAIGALSIRYRATYHLELELAFAGGQEKLQDGTQGDREVNAGTIGLRYRFAADRHWNWWLGAGLGGVSVTPIGASDQQRQDAQRPMGSFAVGLERRWNQFALDAELRGFSIGQRQDQVDAMPVASGSNVMQPPPPKGTSPDQSGGGGILTIGASYYF